MRESHICTHLSRCGLVYTLRDTTHSHTHTLWSTYTHTLNPLVLIVVGHEKTNETYRPRGLYVVFLIMMIFKS